MTRLAVVLVSGGVDSTTLLYKMVAEGYECYPLSVMYGQKHNRELEVASRTCIELTNRWRAVDLSALKTFLSASALTNSDIAVPEGDYSPETQAITVVPNRNLILLSIAAGYAMSLVQSQGLDDILDDAVVAYAAHSSDYAVYPDCRPEFVGFANDAIFSGTGSTVRVRAPFVGLSKGDVVRLGISLGVPYEQTYSCYNGRVKHCGVCGTCRERKIAFEEAGVEDPTEYEV